MDTNLDRLKKEEEKINIILANEKESLNSINTSIEALKNKDRELKDTLEKEANLKAVIGEPPVDRLKKVVNAVTHIKYWFIKNPIEKNEEKNLELLNKVDQDLAKIATKSEALENIIIKEIQKCQNKLKNKVTPEHQEQFDNIAKKFQDIIDQEKGLSQSPEQGALEDIKTNVSNLLKEHEAKIPELVKLRNEIKELNTKVPKTFFEKFKAPFSKIADIFRNTPIEKFATGREEVIKKLNTIDKSLGKAKDTLQNSINIKEKEVKKLSDAKLQIQSEKIAQLKQDIEQQKAALAQSEAVLAENQAISQKIIEIVNSKTSPEAPLQPTNISQSKDNAPTFTIPGVTVEESSTERNASTPPTPKAPPPPPPMPNPATVAKLDTPPPSRTPPPPPISTGRADLLADINARRKDYDEVSSQAPQAAKVEPKANPIPMPDAPPPPPPLPDAPPPPPPPMPNQANNLGQAEQTKTDPRDNLLAQIREGKTLKKVEQPKAEQTKTKQQEGILGSLQQAILKRREAVADDSELEQNFSDSEWDDEPKSPVNQQKDKVASIKQPADIATAINKAKDSILQNSSKEVSSTVGPLSTPNNKGTSSGRGL